MINTLFPASSGSFSGLFSGMTISPLLLIIVLIFVGELLLGLEFFIIPGFGAGGILGFAAVVAAVIIAGNTYGLMWGGLVFLLSSVMSFAGLLLGMRTNLIKKRFVLSTVQKHGQGTLAEDMSDLLGQRGTAITTLRPAGNATFNNRRIDVISDGGYIDAGASVIVTLVEGPRVVVKQIDEAALRHAADEGNEI